MRELRLYTFIISLVMVALAALPANAISTIRIVTKDGSQYEGYISKQGPAMQDIIFKADSFISRVAKASLYVTNGKYSVPLDGGNTIVPVTILDNIGDTVIYSCKIPHMFNIKKSEIKNLLATRDYKTQITGIDRIYKKYNGETIKGKYIGELPGKTIEIIDSLDVIHEIGATDYETCKYYGRFPNESLYEQSPLLDRITTADGTYTGVVSEINYITEPEQDFYLFVESKDGVRQRVRIPAITLYEKLPNPDYKPQYINDIPHGKVSINSKYAFKIPISVNKYHNTLYTVLIPADKTTTIKSDGDEASVIMEICPEDGITTEDQFVILHLKQALLKRYKLEDENTFVVKPSSYVVKESSRTAKYVFKIDVSFLNPLKAGTYAILDKKNAFIIPVFIKK